MAHTVGILTPTIGTADLLQCLKSVAAQTYPVKHYVVIDGHDHLDTFSSIVNRLDETHHIRKIILEENVGKGFYGHRVFAAVPHLMNVDFLIYLDEDNWLQPTHVESLLTTFQHEPTQWVYSLRQIYSKDGTYVCDDNCESLGHWPSYQDYQHIDTSCFGLPIALARTLGPAWHGAWGQDRVFFAALRTHFPSYTCTGHHTVCYRLAGNEGSVTQNFFQTGNQMMRQRYPHTFPWQKEPHS